MSWRREWNGIARRIEGLESLMEPYFRGVEADGMDRYGIGTSALVKSGKEMLDAIRRFRERHDAQLPLAAHDCLAAFAPDFDGASGIGGVMFVLTALASFRGQFEYAIADTTSEAQVLTERAFTHLNRSIVADGAVRTKWRDALAKGETECEKLGAVHLLLHGIWAFKTSAEGERTDLVLAEPLIVDANVRRASTGLVLTEWKVVRSEKELSSQLQQALEQARRYAAGILAGFEVADVRYLVLVSENHLAVEDIDESGVHYRVINVVANPKPPSK